MPRLRSLIVAAVLCIAAAGCTEHRNSLEIADEHFRTCPYCSDESSPICEEGFRLILHAWGDYPEMFLDPSRK